MLKRFILLNNTKYRGTKNMKRKIVNYRCESCDKEVSLPTWRFKNLKNKNLCGKCSMKKARDEYKKKIQEDPALQEKLRKRGSETFHKWHRSRSDEEKSKMGKYARSCVKTSGKELREKQQQFIENSSKEYYEAYCEKRRQIALDFHNSMTNDDKAEHYKKIFTNKSVSKASNVFLNIVEKELNITLEKEVYTNGFVCDAKNKNTIIEFYGDMYHCNPIKFSNPEQYCSWISRTVKEQWKRDERRIAALKKYGYNIIIVWEHEWNKNSQKVLKRIKDEMYKN